MHFDCIVAMKRSGWMVGVFLSHQHNIPLFSSGEVDSIPSKFYSALLVDDKCFLGKSLWKIQKQILTRGIKVTTACMFVQGDFIPDIYTIRTVGIVKMWYEVN